MLTEGGARLLWAVRFYRLVISGVLGPLDLILDYFLRTCLCWAGHCLLAR